MRKIKIKEKRRIRARKQMKFRITPIIGKDKKLHRHMTLMPGVKFEDLTVKDIIEAEEIFKKFKRREK